ncbi:hypothetical protein DND58_24190 [Pseudomonas syringae pv. pisi]|uniref:Uncharacterized protein n=2 Tax=Pseudomonas avellanae TaxID=46257 RepID=A0AAD0GT26_9PSED|nr:MULTISPECIES: hypothetical protein [Pseudomonas syringae group]PYD08635.1 hypothetical protein DND62_26240 [Pseudomonas syringae pv. pisi]AVB22677.1 hypothetical protein BKM03_28240 [Pseudomonas avellanae]EGH08407.1 hypothetical protein PSYMP_06516 [Pseudomonas amygdali pv. morsprunorum str. M302280]KWS68856.1 hypothetical protein AL055_16480 [Pseudomonas amygdali pv. morsprunorum]PHN47589.1 hypothetical protein AO261_00470 [Pseudomonas avellanae]
MKKITKAISKSVLSLVLAALLTKWLVALGLMGWLLQTETGLDTYASAANALGIIGSEDGEFMVLTTIVFVMLVPSAFLVEGAAKALRKFRT